MNQNPKTTQTIWPGMIILLVCCMIAYWPLSFHLFSLKNDALNYFLPVRYQISEAISNGHYPFWSPYYNLGYPLHGDMQSGVWNPFVQIISLFGPYTLATLQFETLLYIYLSGVGMYFLVRYFYPDWRIALLVATSYMLCGFNSDSAQFLNWISAASFLPFIFLFYYRTLNERNIKNALTCGIFLFLMFTTAYPADFILSLYVLLFLLIWHLFKKVNRNKDLLRRLLFLHLLTALCFILLSLPAIISYAEFLPLTERGSGASYAQAMTNPLHPGLLVSWLAPLSAWKASFASVTDPLERNCYFGLIAFVLLLAGFFIKTREGITRFWKWAFILFLLFSLGEMGGIRIIAYYLLPLMNSFRHPANAKLFTDFFACLIAASVIQYIQGGFKGPQLKYAWLLLVTVFIASGLWALCGRISIFSISLHSGAMGMKNILDNLGFYDLLLISLLIQLPFLAAIYYFLVRKFNLSVLLWTGLLNSVLFTALVQPFTVVKKDSVASVQSVLDSIQKPGYPLPDLHNYLLENSVDRKELFDAVGPANLYNKKISRVDYRIGPSNLLTQNQFWFNEKLRNTLMNYPLFYRADSAVLINDTALINSEGSNKKLVILHKYPDSLHFSTAPYTASFSKFNPNACTIEVESTEPGYYCLMQNRYPRWRLRVDGKPQSIDSCNISFMGIQLPAGRHKLSFSYYSTDLIIAFLASICTLLIVLTFLFVKRKTNKKAL